MILYKYLPREYAEALVYKGQLLFRSLSYFRKIEHAERGDDFEGIHIDAPPNPVRLDNLTRGTSVTGHFQFLNSIDQEQVFAFCCSTELRRDLFDRFHADACVRIRAPGPLFTRCELSASWKFSLASPGLLHRSVEYFDPAKPSLRNVKDPRNIPFFKHHRFSEQLEYRAVFARRGGFKLLERIVPSEFTLAEEIEQSRSLDCLLTVGPLGELAEILSPTDVQEAAVGPHAA